MIGEVYSRVRSSLPFQIWRSSIEVCLLDYMFGNAYLKWLLKVLTFCRFSAKLWMSWHLKPSLQKILSWPCKNLFPLLHVIFSKRLDYERVDQRIGGTTIPCRFYIELLHCLHLLLEDPRGSLSGHVRKCLLDNEQRISYQQVSMIMHSQKI